MHILGSQAADPSLLSSTYSSPHNCFESLHSEAFLKRFNFHLTHAVKAEFSLVENYEFKRIKVKKNPNKTQFYSEIGINTR